DRHARPGTRKRIGGSRRRETMIRTLLMLAFSAGCAPFVMPLLAFAQTSSGPTEAARKLREYLDEDWKQWMEEYPEMATSAGFPGQNRRWSDDSRSEERRVGKEWRLRGWGMR